MHQALASHQLRPQRHGHDDVPARASLPERLRRRRALIIFAKDKELTEKESILRAQGALVVVRPDQYVTHVLPLGAHQELAAFFGGFMLPN